jgi:hypothetical protein
MKRNAHISSTPRIAVKIMKTTNRQSSSLLPTLWSLVAALGTAITSLTAAPLIYEPFAQTAVLIAAATH